MNATWKKTKTKNYINKRYTITKVDINVRHITIKNDRHEIVIGVDDFQKLFRIGYAFTTH